MSSASPRSRVASMRTSLGNDEVVHRCLQLMRGSDGDEELIYMLGGPAAAALLASGLPPAQSYWLRVWALRGLLWSELADAPTEVRTALTDEHWRVREMACRVIARHRLGDVLGDLATLESDSVKRVRDAALRAAVHIVEGEG